VLKLLRERGQEVPVEKLNVNGGSIALGHPVGATGARLVLSSLKELHRRNPESMIPKGGNRSSEKIMPQ